VLVPPVFEPMLAGYGAPARSLGEWIAEPKLDGWRCQVTVDPELPRGFEVRTRSGRQVTDRLAEFESLSRFGVSVVLDGELVAGAGRSNDFYSVAPSLARRTGKDRLTFAAFDILWCSGEPTIDLPLASRRQLLDGLSALTDGEVTTIRQFEVDDVDTLLDCCAGLGLEGLVVKRSDSRYEPGRRSRAWCKVKCEGWREAHARRRRPR
jgi:bifunctional non-homologous end joining protein LigD